VSAAGSENVRNLTNGNETNCERDEFAVIQMSYDTCCLEVWTGKP